MTRVAETIADITIPDTALVRDVTAFIRDTVDDLLYHHSRRVFLFGSVRARARGLRRIRNCSTPPRCSTTSG